jgi:hypothetical protein
MRTSFDVVREVQLFRAQASSLVGEFPASPALTQIA